MNWKKDLCGLAAGMYLTVNLFGFAAIAEDQTPKVKVDGQVLVFADQQPVVENDRTLVPMRAIFERLGAKIEWNEQTQTVVAKTSTVTIILKIGSLTANKNGNDVKLEVPAKVINDRTMVPLRFVGESLGAEVKWAEETQTVEITAKTAAAPSPSATPAPTATPAPAPAANGKLNIVEVTASSEQTGNVKANAIDGNLDTRWAADGQQWIMFDIGAVKKIKSFKIAWILGNQRKFKFAIEVSEDGKQWTKVGPAESSGKILGYEEIKINEVSARYVRYTGKGSTANTWNSISEFEIYE